MHKNYAELLILKILPLKVIILFRKLYVVISGKNKLCLENGKFKDLHKGKRCFILCNGPSVKKQDLLLLKNEIVFSVSSGYYHKDYKSISPMYHCVPGISLNRYLRSSDIISWFDEMDNSINRAQIFLDLIEEPIVRRNGLFKNRKVNYLCMAGPFKSNNKEMPDITRIVPGAQSVSIMCLIIAMYMGFKEIYLLGTEHDAHLTGIYKYFYDSGILKGESYDLTAEGKIKNNQTTLNSTKKLITQYEAIKKIAQYYGTKILNATCGGALEVFPRVKLEELFNKTNE